MGDKKEAKMTKQEQEDLMDNIVALHVCATDIKHKGIHNRESKKQEKLIKKQEILIDALNDILWCLGPDSASGNEKAKLIAATALQMVGKL